MLPKGEQKRGERGKRDERQGKQVGEALLTPHEKFCSLSVCFLFGGEKTVGRIEKAGVPGFFPSLQGVYSLIHKLSRRRRPYDQE